MPWSSTRTGYSLLFLRLISHQAYTFLRLISHQAYTFLRMPTNFGSISQISLYDQSLFYVVFIYTPFLFQAHPASYIMDIGSLSHG